MEAGRRGRRELLEFTILDRGSRHVAHSPSRQGSGLEGSDLPHPPLLARPSIRRRKRHPSQFVTPVVAKQCWTPGRQILLVDPKDGLHLIVAHQGAVQPVVVWNTTTARPSRSRVRSTRRPRKRPPHSTTSAKRKNATSQNSSPRKIRTPKPSFFPTTTSPASATRPSMPPTRTRTRPPTIRTKPAKSPRPSPSVRSWSSPSASTR